MSVKLEGVSSGAEASSWPAHSMVMLFQQFAADDRLDPLTLCGGVNSKKSLKMLYNHNHSTVEKEQFIENIKSPKFHHIHAHDECMWTSINQYFIASLHKTINCYCTSYSNILYSFNAKL